jgi:rsbT co-antagonist protein RsbR
MKDFLTALTSIKSQDPEIRRRGLTVLLISTGLAALCLLMIIVAVIKHAPPVAPPILVGAAAILIGIGFLARAGRPGLAAPLVIIFTIFLLLTVITINPNTVTLPFFLALGTLLATVLLPPTQIWLVLIACILGNILAASLFFPDLQAREIWSEVTINSSVLMISVTLIGYLSARGIRAALATAMEAREVAEAASQALANSNAELELRVEERTSDLRKVAAEQQAIATRLQASLQAQEELNHLVDELAVPMIPINSDTLVVPLVGNIDSTRTNHALTSVLERIERDHARTIILDVTGVAVIDTQVAAAFLQMAAATRLMGAEIVLSGIRPEVAQTLVHLGVDLHDLRTAATLQESLAQHQHPM